MHFRFKFSFKIYPHFGNPFVYLIFFLQTPTLATPPTPMPSSRLKKNILFDPPFASPSSNQINPDENSPAQIQKSRNEEKIAFLDKQFQHSSLPSIETTPIMIKRDPKLRKPFKVPFIDRLID